MPLLISKTITTAMALSMNVRGTIGGVTFRIHPRSGTIAYWERRKPGSLSPAQHAHRVKFTRCYEQWATLSATQQRDWSLAADRASTRMIGSHLFMRAWWHQDTWTVEQFARHYHITLVLPGP